MYAPLMHWLKATDHGCYEKLLEVYTTSISKLYERDLRQFFDEARLKVIGLRERKRRVPLHRLVIVLCAVSLNNFPLL